MAEHAELVSEMSFLEKMNTEERLKMARKRRSQQLKRWAQREKEFNQANNVPNSVGASGRKKSVALCSMTNNAAAATSGEGDNANGKGGKRIHFIPSVTLLEAASRNDIDEVRRLLSMGVDPDSTNEDGLTALHQCCIDNLEEMMLLIIEFGANVNSSDSEGWRPLHAASTCGHSNLIKILIDKGADLLAVNADGNMPYDICEDEQTLDFIESEMSKRGVTQELIDTTRARTENRMLADMKKLATQGYDLNYKDEQGATPLHIASANGYMSVVRFLVENNASLDEVDDDLWQPIHLAACWGYIDVIEYLVQAGADLDAKTKNGEIPFDICEDPDLKARILQLKSEMESKRAAAVSSNRLRRSHSQNTRSHSIRRTSVREKAQIAKREAIEEAKLWHEKTIESIDIPHLDSDQDSEGQFFSATGTAASSNNSSPVERSQEVIDGGPAAHHYAAGYGDKGNGMAAARTNRMSDGYNFDRINNHPDQQQQQPNNSHPNNSSNTSDLMKAELHVTLNANTTSSAANYNGNGSAGTLIDLKKQRSEKHRNSLTTTTTNVNNNSTNFGPGGELRSASIPNDQVSRMSLHHQHPHYHHHQHHPPAKKMSLPTTLNNTGKVLQSSSSPAAGLVSPNHSTSFVLDNVNHSPSTVKKRYRGNPSELIGEGTNKKGCCLIL